MNFWIFAIALLLVPAALIVWPLLAGSVKERMTGLFLLVAIPLAGMLLYQQVGTPQAIDLPNVTERRADAAQSDQSQQQPSIEEMVALLQQRMNENPDDPEGWLMLGRSLKTMQRYDEAKAALLKAKELMPEDALILVELAETSLYASGERVISGDILKLISTALEIDPLQQKGLWLMGIALSQSGEDTQAISYWEKLLTQLDPNSGAAITVAKQIEDAQIRAGVAPQVVATGLSIPLTVSLDQQFAGSLPDTAALFIYLRQPGGAGMPLAAKKIPFPQFPLSVTFSDADLLRPGTSLANHDQLSISARISMTGVANSASGDLSAESALVDLKTIAEIALHINQRVP